MSDTATRDDSLLQDLPAFGADGVFGFVIFVPMLFIVQFGTYGAALFVAATSLWMVLRRRALAGIVRSHWNVLLFPAFIIASTLWSVSPGETLKHSLEFSITIVAALLLVSSRNPRAMLLGLFAAFALYTVISVLFGNTVDVGNTGARAFSGLGQSKNEAADTAGAGFVLSTFLAVTALRARRWAQLATFAGTAALQIYAATAAMSAGTVAGMTVSLVGLFLLLVLREAGARARAAFLGIAVACAAAIAAALEFYGNLILFRLAFLFGKDPTLTGRTYLWFRARELIAEHPLLGRGFGAFWQQGNLDAEGLWQFAQITSRQGFNFHNTLYDALVSLGGVGAVVLALTFLLALGRLARDYVARPTLFSCLWLGMALYLFIRMPTECVGLIEFSYSTVLLFMCFGSVRPSPVNPVRARADGSARLLRPVATMPRPAFSPLQVS